jgi:hypothetical protein
MMDAVSAEARIHPRYDVDAIADVIGNEVVLGCPVADVSMGGLRFSGAAWETAGTDVQIVLTFPGARAHLPLQGVVVRSSDRDMGIRFKELNDEQKWALRKHLRELQSQAV